MLTGSYLFSLWFADIRGNGEVERGHVRNDLVQPQGSSHGASHQILDIAGLLFAFVKCGVRIFLWSRIVVYN